MTTISQMINCFSNKEPGHFAPKYLEALVDLHCMAKRERRVGAVTADYGFRPGVFFKVARPRGTLSSILRHEDRPDIHEHAALALVEARYPGSNLQMATGPGEPWCRFVGVDDVPAVRAATLPLAIVLCLLRRMEIEEESTHGKIAV